ncbi:hypothetical protein VTI74DRAFT_9036 [Chaetomium olivicolor]
MWRPQPMRPPEQHPMPYRTTSLFSTAALFIMLLMAVFPMILLPSASAAVPPTSATFPVISLNRRGLDNGPVVPAPYYPYHAPGSYPKPKNNNNNNNKPNGETNPFKTPPPATEESPHSNPADNTQTTAAAAASATLPFPASLYDTPGHAIASGLFIGVAATGVFWVSVFVVRFYLIVLWRGVGGILRGLSAWGRERNRIGTGERRRRRDESRGVWPRALER